MAIFQGRKGVFPLLGLLLCTIACSAILTVDMAFAAPWDGLLTPRSVEADPQANYTITEKNGPWMIMACTFSGENAPDQAKALVLELRSQYNLHAYMHEKTLKLDEEIYGRGIDQYGAGLEMRYRDGRTSVREIAVLVGNFPAIDDPRAQEMLEQLKKIEPKTLKVSADNPTNRTLAGLRTAQDYVLRKIGSDKGARGPMGHAFVTTNPLLPKEYFSATQLDPVVAKMNDGIDYSLLDCPGRYTLQVATFRGKMILDQSTIAKIESGEARMNSCLDKAGDMAYELVVALRHLKYEAYVFHDRNASIVTVGSFESVGTTRQDGKIDLNPKILKLMKVFGMDPTKPRKPGQSTLAKTLIGIPFDIQPLPVQVPRRSLMASHDFSGYDPQ